MYCLSFIDSSITTYVILDSGFWEWRRKWDTPCLLMWVYVPVWWQRQTRKHRHAPRSHQKINVVQKVGPSHVVSSDVQTGSLMAREMLPENLVLTWNLNEQRNNYVKISAKSFPGRGTSKSKDPEEEMSVMFSRKREAHSVSELREGREVGAEAVTRPCQATGGQRIGV